MAVKERRRKKRRKPFWLRHLAWLVPLAGCVLLLALILAIPPLRRTIFRQSEAAEDSQAAQSGKQKISIPGWDLPEDDVEEKEKLEVLPPEAARQSGRKLAKLLLVGPGKSMFPTLAEALKVAIGGDRIEIRTNGPLLLEPGKTVWQATQGTLTISGGKRFQPILARKGPAQGTLLSLNNPKEERGVKVTLKRLAIINVAPVTAVRSKPGNRFALSTDCSVEIQRCLLIGNERLATASFNPKDPQFGFHVEKCYVYGLSSAGRFLSLDRGGKLIFHNNLFVRVGGPFGAVVCIRGDAGFSNNTFVKCGTLFAPHGNSRVDFQNNLVVYHRGPLLEFHDDKVDSLNRAAAMINYRGKNNLHFGHEFSVTGTKLKQIKGFPSWQLLVGRAELNPVLADPLFAFPQAIVVADKTAPPPAMFAYAPRSPAIRTGSDGKDIGADLSLIPAPPPGVELVVQHALAGKL